MFSVLNLSLLRYSRAVCVCTCVPFTYFCIFSMKKLHFSCKYS